MAGSRGIVVGYDGSGWRGTYTNVRAESRTTVPARPNGPQEVARARKS
ncbi:hypothetical protein ACWGH8_25370 [Nonomuraea muscovyensis]